MGSAISFCSDSEHKMEGELLKLLRQTKEAGGSASLTFTTRDGKLKAKLEVELDPSPSASPSSTPPSPATGPATAPAPGGGRRCRKGAAAKAKARARAALHRATQAASRRPLKHLPPAPDGRQAVHTVGRPAMPSFASLNLDSSPPSLPPRPPPPPPPSPAQRTFSTLKVLPWLHRLNPDAQVEFNKSKDCHFVGEGGGGGEVQMGTSARDVVGIPLPGIRLQDDCHPVFD